MDSFPSEIQDCVITYAQPDLKIEERCRKERARLTDLISKKLQEVSSQTYDIKDQHIPVVLQFEIEPSEERGHEEVKTILSAELKKRFPGLEYHRVLHYADVNEWSPVPDNGIAAFEYRIGFGQVGKKEKREPNFHRLLKWNKSLFIQFV